MSKLIVVKLSNPKYPADGGVVVAVADTLDAAEHAQLVPACGSSKTMVRDSNRVIWKGFPGVAVGARVRL